MIIPALVIFLLAALGVCLALLTFDVIILALNALTDWCEGLKQKLKENENARNDD